MILRSRTTAAPFAFMDARRHAIAIKDVVERDYRETRTRRLFHVVASSILAHDDGSSRRARGTPRPRA